MRNGFLVLSLAFLTCAASPQTTSDARSTTFDPKPWLQDFHQILAEMSSHYANLEWAIAARGMDLPLLRRDTETKLRTANDEQQARRILDKFLSSFGDGHLEIQWPRSGSQSKPETSAPQSLCGRLGYSGHMHPGLGFASLPQFYPISTPDSDKFPGGVLRLQNRTVVGILRIGIFSEHNYPQLCLLAMHELHLESNAVCDDKCDDRLEIATADLLTAALVRQAEALAAAGANALLVDIAGNGGGSDWVEPAARALSPVPLEDSRMAFLKHAHWTKQLQDRLRDIQTDIKHHADSPLSLDRAADTIEKAIQESQQKCDRSAVWDIGKIDCSLIVKDLLFASGETFAYAKPGSLASVQSKAVLFYPSLYVYAENPKALPLYVVVDRDTWSAAEYFAALLQDNHAATIIGEVTGGAGCGYTNGGIPARLKNSGAQLKMPDCVRYRSDGTNEVDGITPDIILPWSARDSDFQHAKKLVDALQSNPRLAPQ